MCIIIIAEHQPPTSEFLRRCERENPHGGGIAWIDQETGKIAYIKNVTAKYISDLLPTIQLPYVIHFRIASSGQVAPELCHPFPLGGDLDLEGTAYSVLFHNGTWRSWHNHLDPYMEQDHNFPGGMWSDSRAMAYLASIRRKGHEFLNIPANSNRICLFTTKKLEMYGHWVKEQGFWLSHTMEYGTTDTCALPATDRAFLGAVSTPPSSGYVGSNGEKTLMIDKKTGSYRLQSLEQDSPCHIAEYKISEEDQELQEYLAEQGMTDVDASLTLTPEELELIEREMKEELANGGN